MHHLIRLPLRAPRLVLVAWLLLTAAGAVLATHLDDALSGGGFTNPRAEALVAQDRVDREFGELPNQLVVVLDGARPLTQADEGRVEDLLRDSGAGSVVTPDEVPELLSSDRRTAAFLAGFDGDRTAVEALVPDLQEALDDEHLADAAYVTGQPALDAQLSAHSAEDARRAELIVFPLLAIILLLVFRSVTATVVPLLVAGTAVAVASGLGYLLTRVTEVTDLYSNIVSMIGLAVAVDYSLFIVERFREELRAGVPPREAVRSAMVTAGSSVVLSGIAVVLALAALFIPRVTAFTSIAAGGILVTLVALATTVFVLPAALVVLGHRIDSLRVPLPRWRRTPRRSRPARSPLLGVVVAGLMLAVSVPVASISLQSPVASAHVLPAGDPARRGLEVVEDRLSNESLFPLDVVLSFPADDEGAAVATVAETVDALLDDTTVEDVRAVTTVGLSDAELEEALEGGDVPAELASLWHDDDDGITTRILVTASQSPDSVAAHDLVRRLRAELPGFLPPGATVAVAGATAQGVDFDDTIVQSIPLVAASVLALTFLVLSFAFRSVVLPVVALGSNLLVVLASTGLLVLVQRSLSDEPLNSVTPILLFAVMFGLSMDYLVIILSRMREAYRSGLAYTDAVLQGARQTRVMVNSAAVIMIAVFCSFMTGQISIVREIGLGLALAVALDAVLVRMIVMPDVLRLIGPRAFGARAKEATR